MTKPQLWQLGVLVFASIASSSCCILSRNLECPLRGSTYGGRLILVDGGGLGSGLFPSFAHRGRMIVFQKPPAHLTSHTGGFGRGQIWIGSRSCPDSGSQLPEQCPWTGDRPCIDAEIPCETEPPSYGQSSPLDFSNVTEDSITVSSRAWNETTDLGIGPVTEYKILYRQLDGIFKEVLVDGNHLSHRFDGLKAGTIYQFRVVLVRDGQPTEGPPSEIQNMKTLCEGLGNVHLDVRTVALSDASKSRLVVSWQLPSLTANCNVTHQQLITHQLDKDNCETPPSNEPEPEVFQLEPGNRMRSFELPPNSLFNITYLATNPRGTVMTWQSSRTSTSNLFCGVLLISLSAWFLSIFSLWTHEQYKEPTGEPTNLSYTYKVGSVDLTWEAPPCGERNGNIRYEYIAQNQPATQTGRTSYTIQPLSSRERWTFKVRACKEAAQAECGPYATTRGRLD